MKITDVIPKGEQVYGYLTPLGNIQLEETESGTQQSWVHAAPVNKLYKHPFYGKIEFTEQKIRNFVQNFMDRVRGVDIAIDYGHDSGGPAAGWVRQAESRDNGLWLLVEWTDKAAEALRKKEYRYFSPEFTDEYTDHGGSGKEFKDVLLGGGLTNRPFLKNLIPVNLSEVFTDEPEQDPPEKTNNQEDEMKEFLEKLRKQFNLSEDATEEQILAAAAKAMEDPPAPQPPAGSDELQKQLAEAMTTIAQLQTHQRLSEVNQQLKDWQRGGEELKFALPPALSDKVKAIMLAEKAGENTFTEFMAELLKTGLVDLSEKGKTRTPSAPRSAPALGEDGKSATDRWNDEVQKYLSEHEDATIGDAIEEVARDHPELYDEYRTEAYTFQETE